MDFLADGDISRQRKSLPATVPKSTISFLKELANHSWFAAGKVMRVSTVVPFFAKTMHEIPVNERGFEI